MNHKKRKKSPFEGGSERSEQGDDFLSLELSINWL